MKAYWLRQADEWAKLAQIHDSQGSPRRAAEALQHMDEALERVFGRGL